MFEGIKRSMFIGQIFPSFFFRKEEEKKRKRSYFVCYLHLFYTPQKKKKDKIVTYFAHCVSHCQCLKLSGDQSGIRNENLLFSLV